MLLDSNRNPQPSGVREIQMQQLRVLQDYECKVPVTYFLCSKDTTHISSSMIRGLSKFQNSDIGKYIPDKYEYAVVTK